MKVKKLLFVTKKTSSFKFSEKMIIAFIKLIDAIIQILSLGSLELKNNDTDYIYHLLSKDFDKKNNN